MEEETDLAAVVMFRPKDGHYYTHLAHVWRGSSTRYTIYTLVTPRKQMQSVYNSHSIHTLKEQGEGENTPNRKTVSGVVKGIGPL